MAAQNVGADVAALRPIFAALRPGERRLTVLTGAGVSTECGIPDFRSPGSPWLVHAPIDFKAFVADPVLRVEACRRKFAIDDVARGAKPGRCHFALATLARQGLIRAVVTQNVDGLHQAGGLEADRLVELHGNGTFARCLSCQVRVELADVRRCLDETGQAPICACGGLIKSATVAFGQGIDPDVMAAALRASTDCDIFLVVGSSLTVRPAARLRMVAKAGGARLVIVNREATPLDDAADQVVRAEAGDVLAALACWH